MVALKLSKAGELADDALIQRFHVEAKAAAHWISQNGGGDGEI